MRNKKYFFLLFIFLTFKSAFAVTSYQLKKSYNFENEMMKEKIEKFCSYAESALGLYLQRYKSNTCQVLTDINRNLCLQTKQIISEASNGKNDFSFGVSPKQQFLSSTQKITSSAGEIPEDLSFIRPRMDVVVPVFNESSFFTEALSVFEIEPEITVLEDAHVLESNNRFLACELMKKNVRVVGYGKSSVSFVKRAPEEKVRAEYSNYLSIRKNYFYNPTKDLSESFVGFKALARLAVLHKESGYLAMSFDENGKKNLGIKKYSSLPDFEAVYFPSRRIEEDAMLEVIYE